MTSLGCSLKPDFSIPEDVARRLDAFFSIDRLRKDGSAATVPRSDSAQSTLGIRPDTEEMAGAEDWDPFVPESSENEDPGDNIYRWLRKVELSTYSGMDYVMALHNRRFALMSRCPSENDRLEVGVMCTPQFDGFEEEETEISCGTLFGLGSSRRSETVDCVCVVIGTSKGQVAFYTEKGTLLFVERFSQGPIVEVKFDQFSDIQHVMVVTESEIFSINPFSLLSVLTQAKVAIAKGEQSYQELSDTLEIEAEKMEPEGKPFIGAVVCTGVQRPSAFDQYVTASSVSFNKRVDRPALPNYSTYLIASPSCFGQFAWHEHGEGDGIWTEAFTKISKKIVPHFGLRRFLGWTQDDTRKTWAVGRNKRYASTRGILGESRIAEYLVRAPDRSLVAIVDNHARVLLIDYNCRQIVRIWKGYRDARCAFVTSEEGGKVVLFLVIHAPRRGLLEIWSVQNGVRVGARHVPSRAILIEGGMEMVLANTMGASPSLSSSAYMLFPDGVVHRVDVPFHVALAKTTSHDEHDQMLLHKSDFTTACSTGEDMFLKLFSAFKTTRGRRQAILQMVQYAEQPERLLGLIENLEKIESSQSIADLLTQIAQLSTIYSRLSDNSDSSVNDSTLCIQLKGEAEKLLRMHVDFERQDAGREDYSLPQFLSLIDFHNSTTSLFTRNIPDVDLINLGRFVFGKVFTNRYDERSFDESIQGLPFSEGDLVALLCLVWNRSSSLPSTTEVNSIHALVTKYCRTNEDHLHTFEKAFVECENLDRAFVLCAVLNDVRVVLKNERVRGVKREKTETDERELGMKRVKREEEDETVDEEEMEKDHGDSIQDDSEIKLGANDDVFMDMEDELPDDVIDRGDITSEWESVDPDSETVDCTLQLLHCLSLLSHIDSSIGQQSYAKLAQTGKGYFREQIARYVVSTGICPDELRRNVEKRENEMEEDEEKREKEGEQEEVPEDCSSTESSLSNLVRFLPISLQYDRLACDCAWEYCSIWSREKTGHMDRLESALSYLSSIDCDRLQHGLSRLMWDTFLGDLFKIIGNSMDKTGRAPKDRECRSQLGVSDVEFPLLLDVCVSVLGVLRDAVRETPPPISIDYEEWIEMAFVRRPFLLRSSFSTRESLCEMTVRQTLVNYHLVLHHMHLGMVLQLQTRSSIRCHSIRHLFDVIGNRAFFLPLTSHPLIPLDRVDDGLIEERIKFIEKISNQTGIDERKLARQLCNEWNIQVDAIGIAQVLSLLRIGCDDEASREFSSIEHFEELGEKMARVLAGRILQLSMEKEAVLSQTHETFLVSLAGDEVDRVETPDSGEWAESVIRLGRIAVSLTYPESTMHHYKEMNNICKQNFSLRFM